MRLTKAEEQIMHILWELKTGTVQDILGKFETKPARTTIATVLSILESKNFVDHKTEGRSNMYAPIVSKEDYSKKQLSMFMKNYFNDSLSAMVSFFAKENKLSIEDMDKIIEDIQKELNNK